VILVMTLKVRFDPRGGNREQAFQADGVEGTVSISSVWKKGGSVRTIVWPLSGESFNVLECCIERCSIKHSVASSSPAAQVHTLGQHAVSEEGVPNRFCR
jgi:hypothetical protein